MHYLCFKSLIYAGRAHSESELSQHQSVCLSYLEKLHEKNQQVQHIAFTGIVCIAAGNQFHVHGQHTFQPWCPMGCYCNLGKPVPQRLNQLDLNEARDDGVSGWKCHQVDHMQTICTSLQR